MPTMDIPTYTDGWRASWTKAGLKNQWEPHETAAVFEHYPSHGAQWPGWKDILPDRTPSAISTMACKLGVGTSRRWTGREAALVEAHYGEHGATWDGWGELLPGRTPQQIRDKAKRLGVKCGRWRGPAPAWSADEDDFIASNAGRDKHWPGWADGLPGRTWPAVLQRAHKLGIHVGRGGHGCSWWTDEEDKKLAVILAKTALALGRTEVAVAARMRTLAVENGGES